MASMRALPLLAIATRLSLSRTPEPLSPAVKTSAIFAALSLLARQEKSPMVWWRFEYK